MCAQEKNCACCNLAHLHKMCQKSTVPHEQIGKIILQIAMGLLQRDTLDIRRYRFDMQGNSGIFQVLNPKARYTILAMTIRE